MKCRGHNKRFEKVEFSYCTINKMSSFLKFSFYVHRTQRDSGESFIKNYSNSSLNNIRFGLN